MHSKLESQIDEIYKLPLEEFTKARNALAKMLSGNDKKQVSSLVKPSVAMAIVNQLYWRDPATYKALVDASEKLRGAHRAALSGKNVAPGRGACERVAVERTTASPSLAVTEPPACLASFPVSSTIERPPTGMSSRMLFSPLAFLVTRTTGVGQAWR